MKFRLKKKSIPLVATALLATATFSTQAINFDGKDEAEASHLLKKK